MIRPAETELTEQIALASAANPQNDRTKSHSLSIVAGIVAQSESG